MEGEVAVAKDQLEKVRRLETTTDEMEVGMLQFLTKVSEQKLDASLSKEIRSLMSSINYIERCTDLVLKSSYNLINQKQQKAFFTPNQRNNILNMMTLVGDALDNLEEGFLLDRYDVEKTKRLEKTINENYHALREDYLKKIESGKFTIQSGLFYMDVISELERMADHIYNVVKTMNAHA
jgi:phosphate:Na+ symporter